MRQAPISLLLIALLFATACTESAEAENSGSAESSTEETAEDTDQLIILDETVLFDFGSADLKESSSNELANVAGRLGSYTNGEVRIVGHTDSTGTEVANQELSLARASAVETALATLGIDPERLTAVGAGEGAPIAPNENEDGSDNPEGRAANRRVEIFFSTKD